MVLIAVAALSLCATPAAPTPSPTPLKVIQRVTISELCPALRENLAPAIIGLRTNDNLITQGQQMMAKVNFDAITDPRSPGGTGGAGMSSEMDDVQMSQLVHALAKNLDRIDALLNDTQHFSSRPVSDDQQSLALARVRLQAVAAEQRRVLNMLSSTVETNELYDLASKCDPYDCPAGGPTPTRVALSRALAAEMQVEQNAEGQVAPAIIDVVNRCRSIP